MNYYDSNKKVRPELFDKEAEDFSKGITEITRTQMRRIFNQIKQLNRRLEAGEEWAKIYPLVKLQKAQLAYTVQRGIKDSKSDQVKGNWTKLREKITDAIDSVKSAEDYKVFTDFMEAIYAYHYSNPVVRDK